MIKGLACHGLPAHSPVHVECAWLHCLPPGRWHGCTADAMCHDVVVLPNRTKLEAELAAATDAKLGADVRRLTAAVNTVCTEERLLAADHEMLRCYVDTDLVHDEHETFEPL